MALALVQELKMVLVPVRELKMVLVLVLVHQMVLEYWILEHDLHIIINQGNWIKFVRRDTYMNLVEIIQVMMLYSSLVFLHIYTLNIQLFHECN